MSREFDPKPNGAEMLSEEKNLHNMFKEMEEERDFLTIPEILLASNDLCFICNRL